MTIEKDASAHGFPPGQIIAKRYRIVALLGRGGMGEVYRTDDLELGQTVALKFLPAALERDAAALDRLRAEVRHARQVSHPHVCRVHDIGEVDGRHFLTMEFIDGEDLSTLLRRIGRLPDEKALEIARQLCAGLQAAHDRDVIHRDLKPANVMIDGQGRARITDFGLAMAASQSTEEIAGTPAYMAPELLNGASASRASDVYALGLVLYEVIAGAPPFRCRTFEEWRRAHTTAEPASLSTLVPQLDPAIDSAILRCLEKDPARRPASARLIALTLPGVDPLAAAIAAGETPSPALVAAARDEGTVRRFTAHTLALLSLAMLAVLSFADRINLHHRVPFDKPAAVLADRAQSMLATIVGPHAIADRNWGYARDTTWLDATDDPLPAPQRWDRLRTGQPAVFSFWYRESPIALVPRSLRNAGVVTLDDPPLAIEGMHSLVLDLRGRLIAFARQLPTVPAADPVGAATDWSRCFAAAGLDPAKFTPAQPSWSTTVHADEHRAWTGTLEDHADVAVRIEAAAAQGEPVAFRVVTPWDGSPTALPRATDESTIAAALLGAAMFVVVAVGAALLARRNLRLGRADRRGAARLAKVTAGISVASSLFRTDLPSTPEGFTMLAVACVQWACLLAGAAFFAYVALEPTLRRTRPGLIVSWTRLLAGDAKDLLVGRDLLFGAALGLVSTGARYLAGWLKDWTDSPYAPNHYVTTDSLGGLRFAVASALDNGLLYALGLGFLSMLFLVSTQRLFRRDWIATVVLFVALCTLQILIGIRSWPAIVGTVLAMATLLFTLARFGLLAGVALLAVEGLTINMPLTTDLGSAVADSAIVSWLGVAAIVLMGHRAATRRAA